MQLDGLRAMPMWSLWPRYVYSVMQANYFIFLLSYPLLSLFPPTILQLLYPPPISSSSTLFPLLYPPPTPLPSSHSSTHLPSPPLPCSRLHHLLYSPPISSSILSLLLPLLCSHILSSLYSHSPFPPSLVLSRGSCGETKLPLSRLEENKCGHI